MYQTDFVCTYKLLKHDTDQEQLYRLQFLQAFGLNGWQEDKINLMITDLYMVLSRTAEFNEIFSKARENKNIIEMLSMFIPDQLVTDDIIFNMLFKFEYFDLLHRCIVDYLLNNNVAEKYKNKLLNAL